MPQPLLNLRATFEPPPLCSIVRIDVRGSPATQGSKKFVGMSKAGRGILVDDNKRNKPWRQDVVAAARAVWHVAPIDCPVWLRMVFTLPKPLSAPKRRRIWPDKKPDISKLARSVEDALVDAGVLRDDSRIVEYLRLAKVYPGEDAEALDSPGVKISIMTAVSQ